LTCATSPPVEGKVDCALQVLDHDGGVLFDGTAGVGLRGRSSSSFPKPQYAIELRDAAGADLDVDLFGMGADADWVLNGMYIDRALFRNALAFTLYRTLTHGQQWAPHSAYVELVVDGDARGVYALTQRVGRGARRTPVGPNDGSGNQFIVRADEEGFPSALQYGHWDVVSPKTSQQTPEVLATIEARLQRMESAVAAADATVWDEIDLDSAVAFVLLEELFKNNDAFYLSHHLYTGVDGKLRFVPWDLDLSLGQPIYNDNENPLTWIAYRPDFIARLGSAPGFAERLSATWRQWRADGLADDTIDVWLALYPELLGDAVDRNFARWPIADINFFGDNLTTVHSIEEEQQRVSSFFHARIAFIDGAIDTWAAP
jgi:hypothetical protein